MNDYKKKYVLDATVFIGYDFQLLQKLENSQFYTTPSILNELKDFKSRMNFKVLQETKKIIISHPDYKDLILTQKKIEKIDPNTLLSSSDIEILALSWRIGATLITNDYRLQNLAILLNTAIDNLSGKKITKTVKWYLKCKNCGQIEKNNIDSCSNCNGKLKKIKYYVDEIKSK